MSKIIKSDNIESKTQKNFCSYYQNNCFKCAYRLTDKQGLWCRVEGKYLYEYNCNLD